MAHYQQQKFIEIFSSHFDLRKNSISVLEVGSYDVNGGIRNFFETGDYIGCDLTEGPGVDVVCSGHELAYPDNTFDLAISAEAFEHNPYWVETLRNMWRMTKPGGIVCVTCASTGRLEHGTTRTEVSDSPGTQAVNINYYHNISVDEFKANADLSGYSSALCLHNPVSSDLYFVGLKKGGELKFDSDFFKNFNELLGPVFRNDPSVSHIKILARKIVNLPVSFAFMVLNEAQAQSVAIGYFKVINPLLRTGAKLIKR